MKQIEIYDSDFENLKAKADELCTTVAELISELVEGYLDEIE